MGLLSNLADNLLPRQRRGRRGGGRPLIDMPEFSAGDVGYVGAGLNSIAAIPQGTLNTVVGNVTTALYTTGGFEVNLGGAYKAGILSVQGTADALNDPNKAANSAAVYVGQIIGGRKGNVWQSTYKWNRLMKSFEDRFTKSIIKSSSTLSSDEKNGLLEVMNADAGWLSDSVRKDGKQIMVDGVVEGLKKKGINSTSADRFGHLLDDVSARRKIYRKAGVAEGRSGRFGRERKIADALAGQFSSDPQMQALLKGQDGVAFGSAVADILGATDEKLKENAYNARLKKIEARGGDAAVIAQKLSKKDSKRIRALDAIGVARNFWFGIYSTNLKFGLLNGNIFLWSGYEEVDGHGLAKWMGGMMNGAKMKEMKLDGRGGLLFLAHPGSWMRALWDGDWFKVAEAQLKKYGLLKADKYLPAFLKNGIKGNINNFRDTLLKKTGIKDLILYLQAINPELAAQVQKIFKSGIDEFARSWVKGAIKQAFKKVGESVAKLLTKVGLKKLGEIIGTAILPGIGTAIGWVVGEIVWIIVDSFMWKLFELIVQIIFLVIAIIIVIIMFVTGFIVEVQNMFPVMLLPGQSMNTYNPKGSGEDEYGQEYQGGLGNVVNAETIKSGVIMIGQYCTQGYKETTSHFPYYPGTLALDISNGTAEGAILYSPVDGTVDGIFRGTTSLDKIVIKSNEPADNPVYFHMTHVDADTCRFVKGDSVAKGDSLCTLFYSPTAIYATDSNGDFILNAKGEKILRWSGTHVHIRANNSNGAVANLHELIGLPGIDPETCN